MPVFQTGIRLSHELKLQPGFCIIFLSNNREVAMESKVPIQAFIDELKLEIIYSPEDNKERYIVIPDVSRPGMMLLGFKPHFDPRRIQIIGLMEYTYLEGLSPEERMKALDRLYSQEPVLVIVTRSLDIFDEMFMLSCRYGVPLLRCEQNTSEFMSAAISYLNVELAPATLMHGELVDVYGEGILILGESGVGKSETAIELVKRGHRLIADDSFELRRVSDKTIVGKSPDNIRYFSELRGIGIINVKQLFGVGAVNITERIDLVIKLEEWDSSKSYSKIGMGTETIDLLGLSVPMITIPVRPGRNLAVILEVAAMNFRNLKLGYDAEKELLDSLGMIQ